MSSFNDTWAQASADGNNDDTPPPDGTHDAALIDAGAFTSKQDNDVVKFEWQTVDKQHQWTSIGGFKTTQAAGFTKAACMKVGVDVDSVHSLEELDTALKTHVGGFYEVEVKRNGDFVNTYINDGGIKPPQPDVPADTSDLQPAAAPGAQFGDDVPWDE